MLAYRTPVFADDDFVRWLCAANTSQSTKCCCMQQCGIASSVWSDTECLPLSKPFHVEKRRRPSDKRMLPVYWLTESAYFWTRESTGRDSSMNSVKSDLA